VRGPALALPSCVTCVAYNVRPALRPRSGAQASCSCSLETMVRSLLAGTGASRCVPPWSFTNIQQLPIYDASVRPSAVRRARCMPPGPLCIQEASPSEGPLPRSWCHLARAAARTWCIPQPKTTQPVRHDAGTPRALPCPSVPSCARTMESTPRPFAYTPRTRTRLNQGTPVTFIKGLGKYLRQGTAG
jgi:hypothetical protein